MNLPAIKLSRLFQSKVISHPATDTRCWDAGRKRRRLATVAIALVSVCFSSFAAAQANVRINRVSGVQQPGRWVETVELENTGNAPATDWLVTSQPYNGNKWQYGFDSVNLIPKSGADVTNRRTTVVTIPAGAKLIVTFQYVGAEAKVWNNWYVDVYTTVNDLIINNRHAGKSRHLRRPVSRVTTAASCFHIPTRCPRRMSAQHRSWCNSTTPPYPPDGRWKASVRINSRSMPGKAS